AAAALEPEPERERALARPGRLGGQVVPPAKPARPGEMGDQVQFAGRARRDRNPGQRLDHQVEELAMPLGTRDLAARQYAQIRLVGLKHRERGARGPVNSPADSALAEEDGERLDLR